MKSLKQFPRIVCLVLLAYHMKMFYRCIFGDGSFETVLWSSALKKSNKIPAEPVMLGPTTYEIASVMEYIRLRWRLLILYRYLCKIITQSCCYMFPEIGRMWNQEIIIVIHPFLTDIWKFMIMLKIYLYLHVLHHL